jgi:hypothetical protein
VKRYPFLTLLAALAVLIGGCSDDSTAPATTGNVSGKVLNDFDDTPVAGVTVTVQETGASTTSDASGNYSITGVNPGSYHLNASKSGFETSFNDITITVGQTLSFDVLLSPPIPDGKGRISGRVYDEDGKPMAGVTITTDPPTKSVTTDATGGYRIVPIDMALYDVTASKPGFIPDTQLGDLRFTDDADSVNFTLRDSIPKKGLAAWFKLDGNAADVQSSSNGGTVNGATAAADRFGVAGGALSFNGTSSYAMIPSSNVLNLGGPASSFTISFWVKPAAATQSRYADVLVKGTENTYGQLTGNGYHFNVDYASQSPSLSTFLIPFGIKGDASTDYTTFSSETGTILLDGGWHQIVVTFDRSGKRYERFSDGSLISSAGLVDQSQGLDLTTMDLTSGEPFYIGRNPAGTLFYAGAVDDIRIYNRALSDEEVKMLFHERGWK